MRGLRGGARTLPYGSLFVKLGPDQIHEGRARVNGREEILEWGHDSVGAGLRPRLGADTPHGGAYELDKALDAREDGGDGEQVGAVGGAPGLGVADRSRDARGGGAAEVERGAVVDLEGVERRGDGQGGLGVVEGGRGGQGQDGGAAGVSGGEGRDMGQEIRPAQNVEGV